MQPSFLYKKFSPAETSTIHECLWCGKLQPKNIAHIFSKKIFGQSIVANLLKHSVCSQCNSKIGASLEDYLFKMTPLGYTADLVLGKNSNSLKWAKNYMWDDQLKTWILTIPTKKGQYDLHPIQIMQNEIGEILVFVEIDEKTYTDEVNNVINQVKIDILNDCFTMHISEKYPSNFFSRAFYYQDKLILTGRSLDEIDILKLKLIDLPGSEFNIDGYAGHDSITIYEKKFMWDLPIYIKYCGKIAFEFYSLLAGREKCKESGFDNIRKAILNPTQKNDFELTYTFNRERANYSNNDFIPSIWFSFVDLGSTKWIKPLDEATKDETHKIYIYELNNGLVCATVKLFNFKAVRIVLGRIQELKQPKAWTIIYNSIKNTLDFYEVITNEDEIQKVKSESPSHIQSLNLIKYGNVDLYQ